MSDVLTLTSGMQIVLPRALDSLTHTASTVEGRDPLRPTAAYPIPSATLASAPTARSADLRLQGGTSLLLPSTPLTCAGTASQHDRLQLDLDGVPQVAAMRSLFAGIATVGAWADALATEAARFAARPSSAGAVSASSSDPAAWSLDLAVDDVRSVISHRAQGTRRGQKYATQAFAQWLQAWPEVHSRAASSGIIEDLLCVYSLARRHATQHAPVLWPTRLGKRSLRSHTMSIRGSIRVCFALPAGYKFAAHSSTLTRLGCDDPAPVRVFTFPHETVSAFEDALGSEDLSQISWAVSAVVWSCYRLRTEYWHLLSTRMFDRSRDDLIVFDWDRGDKTFPLRPFEDRTEHAHRVTAADHPVLRRALDLWLPLLAQWGSELLCPVVQPLRYPDARPRGAHIADYKGRRWCIWPSVRRSCRWFGVVLRATARRLGWPQPDLRQSYGLRGGADLEARIRGVSKVVRHAQCWWSLRFMGAQLAYEPPTLPEMAAATREHWATLVFDIVRGQPAPRPPAGPAAGGGGGAAAAVAAIPTVPQALGRGRGRARRGGRGDAARGAAAPAAAVNVEPVTSSDSSSDDDAPPPAAREAARANAAAARATACEEEEWVRAAAAALPTDPLDYPD